VRELRCIAQTEPLGGPGVDPDSRQPQQPHQALWSLKENLLVYGARSNAHAGLLLSQNRKPRFFFDPDFAERVGYQELLFAGVMR
jgi:hypothetical protein